VGPRPKLRPILGSAEVPGAGDDNDDGATSMVLGMSVAPNGPR